MYALPSWAQTALLQSHSVSARVWASVDGSPFGIPLPLVGGSVKIDGTSNVKRELTCSVQAYVDDPAVDPISAELFVEYGIISGRNEVWVPQGVFVPMRSRETQPGLVEIRANDRMQRIIDARPERPITTKGNTVAAIKSLVEGSDYRLTMTDLTGSTATHSAALWEKDRAEAVQKLASSIGAQLVFDRNGNPVLQPVPTLPSISDRSDWRVLRGRGGAKISSVRERTRENTYNAVSVSGEPLDGGAPVIAVARDTTANSPTYWGGSFGKRTRYYATPLVKTTAQAQSVANAMLAKAIGVGVEVAVESLPNPALDYGDRIGIEVVDGVVQTQLLDGYTLPLGRGSTALSTRSAAELPQEG